MAISYQPGGRRVGLEGPSSRGFSPVQAADNSESQLRAGMVGLDSFAKARESQLRNNEEDLQAIVGLSKTATEFMVERQKGVNEDTRKTYLARALNGDIQVKPEAREEFRSNVQRLQVQVDEERTSLTELESTNRMAALEAREHDPVLKGWAAYGDAQGRVLRARGNVALMAAALQSDQAIVPLPKEDGSIEMVSPLEAQSRGPSGFRAAWEITLRAFITEQGLDNINPILLTEELTPAIFEMRNRLLGQSLEATAQRQQFQAEEQAKNLVTSRISSLNPSDPAEVGGAFQEAAAAFSKINGGSLSKGNEAAVAAFAAHAVRTGTDAALLTLEATVINPNDPNAVTIGMRPELYAIIESAREKISGKLRAEQAEQEIQSKAAVEELVVKAEDALSKAPPADQPKLLEQAIQALTAIGSTEATAAATRLRTRGITANDENDQAIINEIRAGNPNGYTLARLENAYARGEISSGAMAQLKGMFPKDAVAPVFEGYKDPLRKAAVSALRNQFTGAGLTGDTIAVLDGTLANRATQLSLEVGAELRKLIAQKENLTTAEGLEYINKRMADKIANDPRFKMIQEPGRGLQGVRFQQNALTPNSVSVRPGGPNSRMSSADWSNLEPLKVPAGVARAGDTFLVEAREAVAAINAGKNVSKDIQGLARLAGVPVDRFVQMQMGLPPAKRAPAFRYEDTLRNPRATASQKLGAQYQRQYIQRLVNQSRPQASTGGEGSFAGSAAFRGFLDATGRAEAKLGGYDAANRGIAGGQPIKGLSSMTIAQVMQLQAQGVYAVGRYQIIPSTLRGAVAREGLDPKTTRFDQATQDRLALNILKNRKDTWAFISGTSSNLAAAQDDMAAEWAVFKGSNGRGRYDGDSAGNYASLDSARHLREMRASYQRQGTRALGQSTGNLTRSNVLSISREEPGKDRFQPGMDLYFKDKQFPSLVDGVVKEVSFDGGYGNYVVIETTDPTTGEKYDVLKSHLGQVYVKRGDRVRVGSLVGKQGGTGRVRSADGTIASVDLFASAPAGSGSMVPYRRWREERERLIGLIK